MGLLQSCLGKNNKVGVLNEEETDTYEKAQQLIMTDEMNEAKRGVAFDLMFGTKEKLKQPPSRLASGQRDENYEKWRGKTQEEKQNKAQERRKEAWVLKQIENAQKEMDRLDKYVNLQESP